MLEEIHIENLGVIQSSDLTFGPGFTAITGETGAGKTMVLTGLGLLLGAKADLASVRAGAESATVEGRLLVDSDGSVAVRVVDAGAALDEDALTIVRTVAIGGRSRAHLGGRSVPLSVLTEIADDLVVVHGQADQMKLRSAAKQRETLDQFGGDAVLLPLSKYRVLFTERARLRDALDEILRDRAQRAQEADLLRFGIEEISAVAPQANEDVELREEALRLTNVEDLRTAANDALVAVTGTDDTDVEETNSVALVEHARRALEHGAVHDGALQGLQERTAEVGYLLADLSAELTDYLANIEADPERLDAINVRRSSLSGLSRKYGQSTNDVLNWFGEAQIRLDELDMDDDRVQDLQAELGDLDVQLGRLAGRITKARTAAANDLSAAVTGELSSLAMSGSKFFVKVSVENELGTWGRDAIEFLLVPHRGAPPRPIAKGASGGELSRVMLALEVALGERHESTSAGGPPRTFVFDEVDAGVGGRAASAVGRRLAQLARTAQVVVVTHLAQVAAHADHHLVVQKSGPGGAGDEPITSTDVKIVSGHDRLVELARMLSGQDSEAALTHARELLGGAGIP